MMIYDFSFSEGSVLDEVVVFGLKKFEKLIESFVIIEIIFSCEIEEYVGNLVEFIV